MDSGPNPCQSETGTTPHRPGRPVTAHDDLSSLRRLRGFLDVTRLVRREEELPELLDAIASAIGESLGYRVVVVHLYRPAWDDFETTTVHGPPEVHEFLIGDCRGWEVWRPLLDDRFLHRGAYMIPHGTFDWATLAPDSYVPLLATGHEPGKWHPEDALFVPLRQSDGRLVGILSVDDPVSGMLPADDELEVLTAMADHAALAIQAAQEAALAARHRTALEQLLAVSSSLTETFAIDTILQSICDGISTALGFRHACVDLRDPDTGNYHTRAAHGWDMSDPAVGGSMTPDEVKSLLDPRFEIEGCFLLTAEQAAERIPPEHHVYHSELCGRGQNAWRDHWLVVPLWSRTGELAGMVWADDPEDRLLPSAPRLQALRVFANQATTALDAASQYEEMQFLAEHDPLTRLLNRRAFNDRLNAEVARASRYSHPLALVLCDLNGFKALNDAHGHAAGDAALERVGRLLLAAIRTIDDAFRIGGDEFALLLPETSAEDARTVIERVGRELEHDPATVGLTAGFGVAVCPADGYDPEQLFRAADAAMYHAKGQLPEERLPRAG
jgi:diguanylate cyclase (GGDEF)-like protein